jgi:hypothetical protein
LNADFVLNGFLPSSITVPQSTSGVTTTTMAQTIPASDSHTKSLSVTLTSEEAADGTRTLTATPEKGVGKVDLPAESTLGATVEKQGSGSETGESGKPVATKSNALSDLPPARKNILLLCFCLSMFM